MLLTTSQVLLLSCSWPLLSHLLLQPFITGRRLGDDIKVVGVIYIKASSAFSSPSPCLFSCIRFIPVGFYPLSLPGIPLLLSDCFNNTAAPPFPLVKGPQVACCLNPKQGEISVFTSKRPQKVQGTGSCLPCTAPRQALLAVK